MSCLGNIIWMIFGGLNIAVEYLISGILMCVTIVGIPFGLQCFKLGLLALWPFGTHLENDPDRVPVLSPVMNIVWFFLGGIWICLTHLFWGIVLCITIIGIPWGRMHFRLARLALSPFGRDLDF